MNAFQEGHSFGRVASAPARSAAASTGKLTWMSAAVDAEPANHPLLRSSLSLKSSRRCRLGITSAASTLCEIPRATGLTKEEHGLLRNLVEDQLGQQLRHHRTLGKVQPGVALVLRAARRRHQASLPMAFRTYSMMAPDSAIV
ncbi:MAG: hypothetical protein EPN40_10820 [Rhodanobacteraceae bacterium]|nr:MAG: hypothetical protein EPN40_10820 [Rhodanobacteraceae bacterium]